MSVNTIVAGNLSDKRIQLFATLDNALDKQVWSAWKQTTDPDSDWTAWAPLIAGNPSGLSFERVLATAQRPNGALQLFADTGHYIATTRKVSPDPDAAWSDWGIFVDLKGRLTGGEGLCAFGVGALSDGRLQAFVIKGDYRPLMTTWMETPDENTSWTELAEFVPTPPRTFRPGILTSPLSGSSVQVWASTSHVLLTTWKENSEPSAAWLEWSWFDVPPQIRPPYAFLDSSAAGPLSDGRIQLWVPGPDGVMTASQVAASPGSLWTDWQPMSVQPLGELASPLAAAPLSDGRLQLWASVVTGGNGETTLFSSWKVSEEPDSAWTEWSEFPTP